VKFFTIKSPNNPRIKELIKLKKAAYRKRKSLFLIEGVDEVMMALKSEIEIESFYICKDFLKDDDLVKVLSKTQASLFFVPLSLFKKASYRENPDGVLAVAKTFEKSLQEIKLKDPPFVVVTEALEKPGNLGAIFRCADAVRADGIIICDPFVDVFNPNVIRASRGALFLVPFACASVQGAIEWLKSKRINIIIATPQGEINYAHVDYTEAFALVVGNEHRGLSSKWFESADFIVKIPMLGKINSLNVATATAVILYEALRQRGKSL